MASVVSVRSESAHKRLFRRDVLERLTDRVCAGEGVGEAVEVSVLFCDDLCIRQLNRVYRDEDKPTDVLSFEQPDGPGDVRTLGDIVISLETVSRRCNGDEESARAEVRLLYCHGLLHLLGYDHQTQEACDAMAARQAEYLRVPIEAAWIGSPSVKGG